MTSGQVEDNVEIVVEEKGSADEGRPEKDEKVAKTDATEKPKASTAAEPSKSSNFFGLLYQLHLIVAHLPGYCEFMMKYVPLLLAQLGASLSFLFAAYFAADELDEAIETVPADLSDNTVIFAMSIVIFLNFVGRLAPFFSNVLLNNLKASLKVDQATRVVAKVFALPHNTMISTPTGEFAQLCGKVFQSDALVPALYEGLFPKVAETFIAFVFLAVAYGWVAPLYLFLFVFHTVVSYRMAADKADKSKKVMEALMKEWGNILGVAGNYEVAHYFGNVDKEVARARKSFEVLQVAIQELTAVEWSEIFLRAFCFLLTLGLLVIVVVGMEGLRFVEMIALIQYFVLFTIGLQAYGGTVKQLRSGIAEFGVLQSFFDRTSDTADVPGAEELPPPHLTGPPQIEFDRVCFSYGGQTILDDVSFIIKPGETVGLVGSSGCGKSTCLRLLMRFYQPTSGVIRVDGKDIRKVTGTSLRRLLSVVTQSPKLFNGTLRENIGYGQAGATDEEILRAAKMAELNLEEIQTLRADGADSTTQGKNLVLDKLCGEGGAKLSGGQQQRVAIARAMLKDGSVYLLDEPTTGLDNVVARQVQATLESLTMQSSDETQGAGQKKATTICVTHHLHELRRAEKILYLESGKVMESGTFEELAAKEDGLFAAQVKVGGRYGSQQDDEKESLKKGS
jgi:ABC-type multidrug transport system fused ATPase/permease subunit